MSFDTPDFFSDFKGLFFVVSIRIYSIYINRLSSLIEDRDLCAHVVDSLFLTLLSGTTRRRCRHCLSCFNVCVSFHGLTWSTSWRSLHMVVHTTHNRCWLADMFKVACNSQYSLLLFTCVFKYWLLAAVHLWKFLLFFLSLTLLWFHYY
jgi:hypothetical protein